MSGVATPSETTTDLPKSINNNETQVYSIAGPEVPGTAKMAVESQPIGQGHTSGYTGAPVPVQVAKQQQQGGGAPQTQRVVQPAFKSQRESKIKRRTAYSFGSHEKPNIYNHSTRRNLQPEPVGLNGNAKSTGCYKQCTFICPKHCSLNVPNQHIRYCPKLTVNKFRENCVMPRPKQRYANNCGKESLKTYAEQFDPYCGGMCSQHCKPCCDQSCGQSNPCKHNCITCYDCAQPWNSSHQNSLFQPCCPYCGNSCINNYNNCWASPWQNNPPIHTPLSPPPALSPEPPWPFDVPDSAPPPVQNRPPHYPLPEIVPPLEVPGVPPPLSPEPPPPPTQPKLPPSKKSEPPPTESPPYEPMTNPPPYRPQGPPPTPPKPSKPLHPPQSPPKDVPPDFPRKPTRTKSPPPIPFNNPPSVLQPCPPSVLQPCPEESPQLPCSPWSPPPNEEYCPPGHSPLMTPNLVCPIDELPFPLPSVPFPTCEDSDLVGHLPPQCCLPDSCSPELQCPILSMSTQTNYQQQHPPCPPSCSLTLTRSAYGPNLAYSTQSPDCQ